MDASAGVLCAVSGGADSIALLHLLLEIGIAVRVFHLNHRLRADASDDACFVQETCDALRVPCVVEEVDVRAEAGQSSVEAAGRRARYRLMAQHGALAATAHTMDDQAETVLLRLLRGAGTRGLAGIHRVRKFGEMTVVRPLLAVRRAELREYLAERELPFREDASNQDVRIPRNRIRHRLLPLLTEHYNPRIVEALARTAEAAAQYDAWLEEASRRAAGSPPATVETLAALPPALLRRTLARVAPQAEWKHLLALETAAREGRRPTMMAPGTAPPVAKVLPAVAQLAMPGLFTLPDWGLHLKVEEVDHIGAAAPCVVYLDADRTRADLVLRRRRPGDRIGPPGMQGHKKLKKLFIDAKIPRHERDLVPILSTAAGEVVWVEGFGPDRRFAVTPQTERIWRFEFTWEARQCSSRTR